METITIICAGLVLSHTLCWILGVLMAGLIAKKPSDKESGTQDLAHTSDHNS